ncbi:MAG: carboxylesterase, partial [Betaproteobacteria bacterium]|nr:carboxylesterase [Betaproteobacteria bacterium]
MNLIEHIELATGPDPKGTVIWMHGLGADCWDFVPVVKELGFGPDLPLRFIFPQAPSRPISINNGYVMPGWYDIAMMEIERK